MGQSALNCEESQWERIREERRASQSGWKACCYAPRKPSDELESLQFPPYRSTYLTKVQGELDSDTEYETKQVHFSRDEVTVHEWLEDGPEWAQARRSDDVDWANLSEKIANVNRIAFVSCRLSLPHVLPDRENVRKRASIRRRNSRRKSLEAMGADTNFSSPCSTASTLSDLPKWTKKDLEVWNPEHIKAVTVELFERHDIGKKGRLSWQDREVLSFVEDFFELHACLPPQLQSPVFSTAYNQVKVESLPSHRDVDGLDMAETCDFARRVYDFIINESHPPFNQLLSHPVVCSSGQTASSEPRPELQSVQAPFLATMANSSTASATLLPDHEVRGRGSATLLPDHEVSMVPA